MEGRQRSKFRDEVEKQSESLAWIMRRPIREILQLPTHDQVYDNISFKLGAFYKLYWENQQKNGLKQNTRKAGEIVAMAENMLQISRSDDRYAKVCAYARQIKKFEAVEYEKWKDNIWKDLDEGQRKVMIDYVEMVTPPNRIEEQPKDIYDQREKEQMSKAYRLMKRGMILVQIFNKIWTIRKDEKDGKHESMKRYQSKTQEMLKEFKQIYPDLRAYCSKNMGVEEWKVIEQLW